MFASWKKSYNQPRQHIKKQNITWLTKTCLVKSIVYPVVVYGWESWTIKKPEHWRTDAFELWCWRRLLRVPWISRRSNQFILKEISPEYSLEGLMLKLILQYFGHLMLSADSMGKTLMLGKTEGRRRRGRQRMRWLDGITDHLHCQTDSLLLSHQGRLMRQCVSNKQVWIIFVLELSKLPDVLAHLWCLNSHCIDQIHSCRMKVALGPRASRRLYFSRRPLKFWSQSGKGLRLPPDTNTPLLPTPRTANFCGTDMLLD